VKSCSS